jgi:hypothetical protein
MANWIAASAVRSEASTAGTTTSTQRQSTSPADRGTTATTRYDEHHLVSLGRGSEPALRATSMQQRRRRRRLCLMYVPPLIEESGKLLRAYKRADDFIGTKRRCCGHVCPGHGTIWGGSIVLGHVLVPATRVPAHPQRARLYMAGNDDVL